VQTIKIELVSLQDFLEMALTGLNEQNKKFKEAVDINSQITETCSKKNASIPH